MSRPDRYFDWHEIAGAGDAATIGGTRRRLRVVLAGFAALACLIFGRAVQLEATGGRAFRKEANEPLRHTVNVPGVRGRILARDGSVLACDRKSIALAVHYRYLEDPPDADWLRSMARLRLGRAERRQPERVAAEMVVVAAELRDLQHRLAALCNLSEEDWRERTGRIQRRVSALAERVNRRHLLQTQQQSQPESPPDATDTTSRLARVVARLFTPDDSAQPATIIVAEQTAYHIVVADLAPEVVAEIEAHPEMYPGVRTTEHVERTYPAGMLAAHVVGHLGPLTDEERRALRASDSTRRPDEHVGRMGIERWYDGLLRGQSGIDVQLTDRRGKVLSIVRERQPLAGRDMVLTLDPALQRSAESLLDQAIRRHANSSGSSANPAAPSGGAIVVLNVQDGAILAAASAPRFDPNWFVQGDAEQLRLLLNDSGRPLFNRVSQMAIPPGSVFKTLSAVALLESGAIDARESFHCQGYLEQPDRQRCAVFQHFGIGHGDVTLADALAQSCNVFFFHFAGEMGADPLWDWADRFGFGRPCGVDLPGEAAGQVPTRATIRRLENRDWQVGDTQALAIGQSALTVTPLQAARMMAAIANGGRMVTPHFLGKPESTVVAEGDSTRSSDLAAPIAGAHEIVGLHPATLEAIREGLCRCVADPSGTAYATARLDWIEIAGKTGTAQTGAGQADHAWFAGYVPAENPQYAFVVVLEHGGGGADQAGPLARSLVQRMQQLGYFGEPDRPHEGSINLGETAQLPAAESD